MEAYPALKVSCSRKELSCIISNLFAELRPVCDVCEALDGGDFVMGGLVTGTENEFAYVKLTDYGFEFYGDNEVLAHIREARCTYGTALAPEKDGSSPE